MGKFDFVERARAVGIAIPIIPGIMPIASVSGIRRMAAMNGTGFPAELVDDEPEVRGHEVTRQR